MDPEHPPDHSHPARVLTNASARNVPAGCGSDDLTSQNGVAVVADAVGMVSTCHAEDVELESMPDGEN